MNKEINQQLVSVEHPDGSHRTALIRLREGLSLHKILPDLEATVDECMARGNVQLILDLKNVQYPTTSFIAFLISATARARRQNGDLKLINVAASARNNLVTFSPLTYLSVEKDEAGALDQFDDGTVSEEAPAVIADDIAEFPEIERLTAALESIPEEQGYHFRAQSAPANLYSICDFVTEHARRAGMQEREIGKTKIAVYEACLNVIEHAYHSNPNEWIDVWVDYDDVRFTIVIKDTGTGFDLRERKDYDVEEAMDHRRTGGFGLYIIQRSMDHLEYTTDPVQGNRLTMVKNLR
jgi:anti-sigma regulatory factor (Ser/Thr protein kinase)/anti-anti-sigma regulatory factor